MKNNQSKFIFENFGNLLEKYENSEVPTNLINSAFTERDLKALFIQAMRVDIPNNNVKATIIARMLPEPDFKELGTGTNRIAFLHNGFVYKIALDRRGFVDNWLEYRRSPEVNAFTRTYETNFLINVAEWVTPMEEKDFLCNETVIKEILKELSYNYLFNDIGFTLKNFANWGYRQSDDPNATAYDDDIVILDYGYMYPLLGQSEELFKCPKCGFKINWNSAFTKFCCQNTSCGTEYSVVEVWRRMDTSILDKEDELLMAAQNMRSAKASQLEQAIAKFFL